MRLAPASAPRTDRPRTLIVRTPDGLQVFHLTDYDADAWQSILVLAEFLALQADEVIADSLSCTALLTRLRHARDDLGGFASEREGA